MWERNRRTYGSIISFEKSQERKENETNSYLIATSKPIQAWHTHIHSFTAAHSVCVLIFGLFINFFLVYIFGAVEMAPYVCTNIEHGCFFMIEKRQIELRICELNGRAVEKDFQINSKNVFVWYFDLVFQN